jgi:hypothetical protein
MTPPRSGAFTTVAAVSGMGLGIGLSSVSSYTPYPVNVITGVVALGSLAVGGVGMLSLTRTLLRAGPSAVANSFGDRVDRIRVVEVESLYRLWGHHELFVPFAEPDPVLYLDAGLVRELPYFAGYERWKSGRYLTILSIPSTPRRWVAHFAFGLSVATGIAGLRFAGRARRESRSSVIEGQKEGT